MYSITPIGSTPVVAISGVKNSGKTTLIAALLPHLTASGLKVAVIKHDGHTFTPDVSGTDTCRHRAAGAYATAIFDGTHYQLVKAMPVDETALIPLFPEADLILLEGFKHSPWPKLELVRAGNSAQSVCDPSTLLGLVTDLPLTVPHVPLIPFGDVTTVAALILQYARGDGDHA